MYTQLVQTMGAHVLLVPSAFTVPTGRAHWHTLLRGTQAQIVFPKRLDPCGSLGSHCLHIVCSLCAARAIENQCYVIAAAQYGPHNAKRASYGHSMVVNPWGTILVDAGGADSRQGDGNDGTILVTTPSIQTCRIDLAMVHSVRERMPIQQHRSNAKI
jgi:deaminated glutathione amidase